MHQMILQRKQTLHTIVDCDIVTNKVVKAPDTFFFPSDFDSLRTFWTKKNSTTQQKTYGWDTKKSTKKIKNIKKKKHGYYLQKVDGPTDFFYDPPFFVLFFHPLIAVVCIK